MNEFSTKHVYDTHYMLSFLQLSFVVVFVFAILHSRRNINRTQVQERFHGLVGTFGYLGF